MLLEPELVRPVSLWLTRHTHWPTKAGITQQTPGHLDIHPGVGYVKSHQVSKGRLLSISMEWRAQSSFTLMASLSLTDYRDVVILS